MLTKKTCSALAAGSLLLAAAPALASPPHWAPAHGWRAKQAKPVVVKHYYHPAPVVRHVVVTRPVYVAPAPVVVHPSPVYYGAAYPAHGPNVLGTLGGAVIGAAVGSQIGKGTGNTAAIAVGATVGGVIGSGW